jgi:hypothetical protein
VDVSSHEPQGVSYGGAEALLEWERITPGLDRLGLQTRGLR